MLFRSMSEGRIVVVAPAPQGQSGDDEEVVLESVEHDEDDEKDEKEYDSEAFRMREDGQVGEEAGELEVGEGGEGEMDMDMDEGSE